MTNGDNTASPASSNSTTGSAEGKPRRKGSVAPRSIRGRLMAGILLIIPLAVTAILINYVYRAALRVGVWLVYWASKAFFFVMRQEVVVEKIAPDDAEWPYIIAAIGLTLLMLYVLGWLGTNVVGRRLIDLAENLVERIPFVDTIYGAIRRMVHALSGVRNPEESKQRVVLIGFPDANLRAIAFMTNEILDVNTGQRYATVYVPTTPNPTSGYMEIVPIERVTETDLTMEQALSMILSGGATSPPKMRLWVKPEEAGPAAAGGPPGPQSAPEPEPTDRGPRPGAA